MKMQAITEPAEAGPVELVKQVFQFVDIDDPDRFPLQVQHRNAHHGADGQRRDRFAGIKVNWGFGERRAGVSVYDVSSRALVFSKTKTPFFLFRPMFWGTFALSANAGAVLVPTPRTRFAEIAHARLRAQVAATLNEAVSLVLRESR